MRFLIILVGTLVKSGALVFPLQPDAQGNYDVKFNVVPSYATAWETNHHALVNAYGLNAVAVASRWFITAAHVVKDFNAGDFFNDDANAYYIEAITNFVSTPEDLALVRVNRVIPHYSELSKTPPRQGDIVTVYGQSAAAKDPMIDGELAVCGWQLAPTSYHPALRWGMGRLLDSRVDWPFTASDPELGLNCGAAAPNDSGGGIFIGEKLIGVVAGGNWSNARTNLGQCMTGHVFKSSMLFNCSNSQHPQTASDGIGVYSQLGNIFAAISPPSYFYAGNSPLVESGKNWKPFPPCDDCAVVVDNSEAEIDASNIANPPPEAIYKSAIQISGQPDANLRFEIDDLIKYERYRVRLHFAGWGICNAPEVCAEDVKVNGKSVHFDPYRGVEKASELAFEEIIPDEDNRIQIEVSPANPGGNVLLSGLEVEMIPRWLMPPPTILFGSITAFGPPQGDMFLAYGNGRFVAGGGGGPYYSDDNGNAWISPHNALGGQSMIYANGIFVGTTGGGVISSRDGRYWTKHQPTNGFWIPNGVSYGNGVFVVTTDTNPSSFYNNSLGVSSDGENWNYYPATNMNLAKTVFGNGRFISISSLTNGLFSEDGIHWSGFFTGIELPARYRGGIRPAGLMFGNGSFFMESSLSASNQMRTFVSADGLAWVPLEAMLPLHNASSYQYDYFLTGTFFSLGAGVMSRDLTNWPNVPVLEGPNIGTSIAYGNSVYLLTGGTGPIGYPHTNVFVARGSSIDALEKIDATFFTASYKSVAVRGNTVAALDSSDDLKSSIYVSTNMGDSFEIVSGPPGVSALISVASGDDRFIAVGERGTLIQSMNGMDWTTLNSSVAADFTGVVFAGQRWFVLGKDGTMLTSPDGQKFSNVPTGATNTLRGLAYGQGAFVSAGDNGTILVSSDGLNWSANKSGTNDLSAVAFGNGLFLVTAGDRLLASADGLSWRDLNYLPITGLVGMAWADGVFCTLSGNNACVSTNGVVWAERPTFGSPTGVVSTGGKTWIYGSNALLSRLILQSPARPSLNAVSNPDGTFTLRIDVPGRADYSILAALSLDANTDWQKLATLTNIASATKWTDYSRARGVRFFQVRQE